MKPEAASQRSGDGRDLKQKSFYIRGFDGLRAVSIIMVVLTHLGVYDMLPEKTFTSRIWHTISGDVGVNIFFVLSGFLITTLLLNEKISTGTISYRKFIARRFLRLLPPLVFFYAIIFYLLQSAQVDYRPYAFITSVFYCYNFIPNKFGLSELSHTWSLAVEEQFYVMWPWILYAFSKKGTLITAFIFIAMSVLAITFLPDIIITYQSKMYLLKDAFKVHRWFLPAIAPIMTGCVFAVLNFFNPGRIKNITGSPIILLFAAMLIFSAFLIPETFFRYLFIIQAPGFAIMLCFIFNNQYATLANLLEWKPVSFIGKISYSIYVWQGLFLRTGPGGNLWIQQLPQNIILTFTAAVISFYTIERAAKKLKEYFKPGAAKL